MQQHSILGKVEGGKFIPVNPSLLQAFEGKMCELKRYFKQRTNPLNKYYWKCVVGPIADYIGDETDAIHEMLKQMFLSYITVKNGLEIKLTKSTAKLNTSGFLEYLSKIKTWASKFLGIYILDPNEVT